MLQETRKAPVVHLKPGGVECPANQGCGAVTHHRRDRRQRQRFRTILDKQRIDRVCEIPLGVDQRAVEIENDQPA